MITMAEDDPSPHNEIAQFPTLTDSRGRYQILLRFSWAPMLLEDTSLIRRYENYKLPCKAEIYKISTFLGWDRGDIGECGVGIFDESGRSIYERTDHKEAGVHQLNFWVWKSQLISTAHFNATHVAETDAVTQNISIHVDAWPTGINMLKHTMKPMVRPDLNIRLWCKVLHE